MRDLDFIGYWLLVIGYWLLVIGYWLLARGEFPDHINSKEKGVLQMVDTAYFSDILNEDVQRAAFLTQGQIGPIYRLETHTGRYLLKTSEPSDRLATEANMLEDIKKYDIASPQVFDVSRTHLLMEYIEEERVSVTLQEEMAAQTLAKLHSVGNDAHMYGYWYDTTIGPFEQRNEQTQYHWALFWAQMRLMPMAQRCYESGALPKREMERIEVLCSRLYTRIDMRKIVPSLIHGDLWSGNILFNMKGAVLIDPALYFADREVELAFIAMFNTFGERFWEVYTQVHPLSGDFYETRVPLYQLYYYLVHMAIYGESYLAGTMNCLDTLKV